MIATAAIAAGCGESDDGPATTTEAQAPSTSEQPPSNPTDEQPEPATGNGDGGVELTGVGNFDQPVYVTQAEGDADHLYVVEQCGRVQRVPVDGGGAELFLDVEDEIVCGGEQGLLSIAFDPDYANSGLFYIYYTDPEGDQRIVEYRRSDDPAAADPDSARELLAIDDFASNHNGGLLLFGPDGELYAGTGDGGGAGDPERNGQDLQSPLGKLLRLDRGPNPGDPEIAAYGLRNPWRYSFDRMNDNLWIGDVGQDSLEEIDAATPDELAREQLNFGWSAFEGTEPFNSDQRAPGAIPPVHEYGRDAGCSVTGGYVVRDPELRSLYGRYLYGDFCAGQLRSFTADPGREADDDRELGLEVPQLSSFGEDLDGNVYAVSLDGPVYRLDPEGGG